MSAREMFIKLGFKRAEDKLFITYHHRDYEGVYIKFCKYSKTITNGNLHIITLKELKAIKQQIIELGWEI